jgi:hypothetical protein
VRLQPSARWRWLAVQTKTIAVAPGINQIPAEICRANAMAKMQATSLALVGKPTEPNPSARVFTDRPSHAALSRLSAVGD